MIERNITQCDMILAYMRKNGSITQKEALVYIGCARLASRINDLRRAGYAIKTNMVYKSGEYAGRKYHVKYASYSLS